MTNYDELPLFPLPAVLYPDMPLPLSIFEPRYREMILRCRDENLSFGVVLSDEMDTSDPEVYSQAIGTTARITQYEELSDGCMNILVTGETRFRVLTAAKYYPYLTAQVEPIKEPFRNTDNTQAAFEAAGGLFRDYVKVLFRQTGRTLSTLQLPQEPEALSYVIAAFLPVSLSEKQLLLETVNTGSRLEQEIGILVREMIAPADQDEARNIKKGTVTRANSRDLSRLASRN